MARVLLTNVVVLDTGPGECHDPECSVLRQSSLFASMACAVTAFIPIKNLRTRPSSSLSPRVPLALECP